MLPSLLPIATIFPSGLKATLNTLSVVGAVNVFLSLPVIVSDIQIALPQVTLTIVFPSGLNDKLLIYFWESCERPLLFSSDGIPKSDSTATSTGKCFPIETECQV